MRFWYFPIPFVEAVVMALTAAQIDKQRKAGRRTPFLRPADARLRQGSVLWPFQRRCCSPIRTLPYQDEAARPRAVAEVRRYADEHIDAAAIDRNAEIPAEVVAGLGRLGVLGMTAPTEYGGPWFLAIGQLPTSWK